MFTMIRKALVNKTAKRAENAAKQVKKHMDNLGGYTLNEGLSLGMVEAFDAQEWRIICAKRLGIDTAAVEVTPTAVYATLPVLFSFVRVRVA